MSFPYKELNKELEQKFLSYCLRTQDKLDVEDKYISSTSLLKLYNFIRKLKSLNLTVTIDEIVQLSSAEGEVFEKEELKTLHDMYTNFENIDHIINSLKENYILNNVNIEIIDKLHKNVINKEFHKESLKQFADNILVNLYELDNKKGFMTSKELADKYRATLKSRSLGEKIRSLGFKLLNDKVPRRAAAGEMSTIFAQKGVGKSTVASNMISGLTSERVPVVKFGLEMPDDTEMDRYTTIATNLSNEFLYKTNREIENPRQEAIIQRSIDTFESFNNYVHIDTGLISIAQVDIILGKIQKYFESTGVFKHDNYMFVVFDLASMIIELAEAGTELGPQIDKFFSLTKKYNCHFFNVVQANENKLRGSLRFKNPEELDRYALTTEDIKNGSAWAERSRQVYALTRPLLMKKQYFPDRMDEWDLEEDILWFGCIKNNNGKLFRLPFVLDETTSRIHVRQNPNTDVQDDD